MWRTGKVEDKTDSFVFMSHFKVRVFVQFTWEGQHALFQYNMYTYKPILQVTKEYLFQ